MAGGFFPAVFLMRGFLTFFRIFSLEVLSSYMRYSKNLPASREDYQLSLQGFFPGVFFLSALFGCRLPVHGAVSMGSQPFMPGMLHFFFFERALAEYCFQVFLKDDLFF